ncbi:hypothetical protein ACFVUR_09355 [Stenotrophomonas bentonitica]|uniref:hypothetical protein n=1 Tax=Stenotrophomonas bentonitica TaxID=1450134 RepID=UPI0036E84CAD
MERDVQHAFAYLIGRGVAAEKALQTAINSNAKGTDLADILRINLKMTREQLASHLAPAKLGPEFLSAAEEGFDAVRAAALRGAANGKFVIPRQ